MTLEPMPTINKSDEKVIYLTFDDGPNEPYTSKVLEVLAEYNAKATFFVCGKNIERSPESIKKIVSAGHAIGIHSYSHNPWKVLTGDLMDEIETTRQLIRKYTLVDTQLYRSPWGITMPWLAKKLDQKGYIIFHWNKMAFDWWQPSAGYIARRLLKTARSGDIVLLHDGDQTGSESRANTVEALYGILKELAAQNYQFKSLNTQVHQRGGFKSLLKDLVLFMV